jgi:murein DD-endopeptidase MepM/ murein hydrolase activator NlpD
VWDSWFVWFLGDDRIVSGQEMHIKEIYTEWILAFGRFLVVLSKHVFSEYLNPKFQSFESVKSTFVGKLYIHRGKNAQVIVNLVVIAVMVLGVVLGPTLVSNDSQAQAVLSGAFNNKFAFAQEGLGTGGPEGEFEFDADNVLIDPMTQVSEKPRAEVFEYTVEDGDTLAAIAKKFGVNTDSILWLNKGVSEKKLKPGTALKIPPVTGVMHTVKNGETVYSIAKRYNVSAQAIVDFPFNEFSNDETFALAIGQSVVVPDGEMPDEPILSPRNNLANVTTPNAGAVSATGKWLWPAAGSISQGYRPWHKAVDIANRSGGPILAADAGTVIVSGWPDNSGYGNRVILDHGNGYKTLYAHMSKLAVKAGQTVKRGDKLGDMGSTGRSTGTHLHFEIRTAKGNADPVAALK